MPLKTTPFDGSEYLDDAESQAEILQDAVESGQPEYLTHILGIIARARGMTSIAKEAGVTRKALYDALSDDGDPKQSALMGVAKALAVKLSETPRKPEDESPPSAAAE